MKGKCSNGFVWKLGCVYKFFASILFFSFFKSIIILHAKKTTVFDTVAYIYKTITIPSHDRACWNDRPHVQRPCPYYRFLNNSFLTFLSDDVRRVERTNPVRCQYFCYCIVLINISTMTSAATVPIHVCRTFPILLLVNFISLPHSISFRIRNKRCQHFASGSTNFKKMIFVVISSKIYLYYLSVKKKCNYIYNENFPRV